MTTATAARNKYPSRSAAPNTKNLAMNPAVGGMPELHQARTISQWAQHVALQRRIGCDGMVVYRMGGLDQAVAAFFGNHKNARAEGMRLLATVADPEAILAANGLHDSYTLGVGQVLQVP